MIQKFRWLGLLVLTAVLSLAVTVSAQGTLTPTPTPDPNATITWPPPVYVVRGPFTVYGTANLPNMTGWFLEQREVDITVPEDQGWIPVTLPTRTATNNSVLGVFKQRPGLLGMMLIYFGINFTAALTYYAILAPMVLARTGGDEIALGNVQAAMGVGGIIGGVLMSVWGGPKRRVHGIFVIGAFSFLTGDFLMAVGRTQGVWMFAILFATIFVPIIVGSKQTIWQSKVSPELQGRVFAARGAVEMLALPIGYLAAGPLADKVLEPAMQPGGALASVFGGLLGTGPGAGMAFMFLCTSIAGTVICLSGYLFKRVRQIETDLPDHTMDGLPTAS